MRDLSVRSALIPRVRQRLGGRARCDRGAIGVLVAIFLAVGVLFGMGAMVIDVGRAYQNRAELQNGADAAALAVAQSCAAGNCAETSAQTTAQTFADENASALTGNMAGVLPVCGSSGSGLTTCTVAPAGCPANPASGTNFVDVQTQAKSPSGSFLPPVFAQTLISGYQGQVQYTCAQATWSSALAANMGITLCKSMYPGTNAPMVSYPITGPIPKTDEVTLDLSSNSSCGAAPGTFGWMNPCANSTITSTYVGNNGATSKAGCDTNIADAWTAANTANSASTPNWLPAIQYVPLFSTGIKGTGDSVTYTLDSVAAFVVTSYKVPSGKSPSDWLGAPGCGNTNKCVTGFWVAIPNLNSNGTGSSVRLSG
jgi:Flp pilus assembly protein TadG